MLLPLKMSRTKSALNSVPCIFHTNSFIMCLHSSSFPSATFTQIGEIDSTLQSIRRALAESWKWCVILHVSHLQDLKQFLFMECLLEWARRVMEKNKELGAQDSKILRFQGWQQDQGKMKEHQKWVNCQASKRG